MTIDADLRPTTGTCIQGEFAPPLASFKRILIARLDGIGDAVLTVPMLRGLRQSVLGARITLLVSSVAENFFYKCPYVDEVLAHDIHRTQAARGRLLVRRAAALAGLALRLRRRRFDLAISPRWDADVSKTGLITYLSGAQRRVGYARANRQATGALASRYFTHAFEAPAEVAGGEGGGRHEVLRNLDLLGLIGGSWQGGRGGQEDGLECWLTDDDAAVADRLLAAGGVREGGVVALCPGAGNGRRMWPIERFAEVGRWLRENHGCRGAIIGGPGEEALGRELADRLGDPGTVDCVGRLTLRQTAALLKRCRLYVGNDTGLMHLAAAVGLPCVEISCHPSVGDPCHANAPERFHPWGVHYRVARPAAPRPAVRGPL